MISNLFWTNVVVFFVSIIWAFNAQSSIVARTWNYYVVSLCSFPVYWIYLIWS